MATHLPMVSLETAVATVRKEVGYAVLDTVGILTLQGPDATTFLQNRTTNDVKALQPGDGQANALADRKGHIQGTFSLHRDGETYWLLTDREQVPVLQEELLKYKIMEVFDLVDQSKAYGVISVQGPQALSLLQQGLATGQPLPTLPPLGMARLSLFKTEILLVQKSMAGAAGYLMLVPQAETEAFYTALQQASQGQEAVEMNAAVQEILRIEAGIPKMGIDMDPNTLLPETGLEQTSVSYSKGCYLGQETIARVRTYGAVQRALVGLLFPTGTQLPSLNTPIFHEGKLVGTLKSHTESPTLGKTVAMAYLGKEERVPGRQLSLEIAGQSYEATVTLLPFYRPQAEGSPAAASQAEVLMKQGLEAFASEKDPEAIRLLQEAIALDPNLADAYESLGVILSRHERFEEAIALMQKLTEIDPGRVMAHTNLSIYYMKLGDKEKAEEEKAAATVLSMQKAMKAAGGQSNPDADRLKREQAILERIELFKEALQYGPEDPLTNYGLGSAYLELGHYGLAIIPLEKTLQVQPNHSVAYLSLGKAYEGVGSTEKAKGIYQTGIEVASKRGDLMPLQEMQQRLGSLPLR